MSPLSPNISLLEGHSRDLKMAATLLTSVGYVVTWPGQSQGVLLPVGPHVGIDGLSILCWNCSQCYHWICFVSTVQWDNGTCTRALEAKFRSSPASHPSLKWTSLHPAAAAAFPGEAWRGAVWSETKVRPWTAVRISTQSWRIPGLNGVKN